MAVESKVDMAVENKSAVPVCSDLEELLSTWHLPVRCRRCFGRLRLETVGDLVRKTAAELLEAKSFGVTSLDYVRHSLAERGLTLQNEDLHEVRRDLVKRGWACHDKEPV